jgi:hypothetical protein
VVTNKKVFTEHAPCGQDSARVLKMQRQPSRSLPGKKAITHGIRKQKRATLDILKRRQSTRGRILRKTF